MLTTARLIKYGYFPKELPPPFTTSSLSKWYSNVGSLRSNNQFSSECGVHNLSRAGSLRRKLGIVNPVNFIQIAQEIVASYTAIRTVCYGSKYSRSKPVLSGIRAINRSHSIGDLLSEKVSRRSLARYFLKTDISRCYHSFYTHSIPWALHTKTFAKANQNANNVGNRLDKLFRNAQSKQTIGIPIGPDTSYVIGEMLLSYIDSIVHKKLPNCNGHRYTDDYEFVFQSKAEAEEFLGVLQETLSEFELELNLAKTVMLEMPWTIDQPWAKTIRGFSFRENKGQFADLINFYDSVFDFASKFPDESVLKYAIAKTQGTRVKESNWELFQKFLLNCAFFDAGCLPDVLMAILAYSQLNFKIDRKSLHFLLNHIVEKHAPIGHGSEVAWALWGLIEFNLPLEKEMGQRVLKLGDPVAIIILCHLDSLKLVSSKIDWTPIQAILQQSAFSSKMWLPAYEISFKKWLKRHFRTNVFPPNSDFLAMKQAGVSFYESNARINVKHYFLDQMSEAEKMTRNLSIA